MIGIVLLTFSILGRIVWNATFVTNGENGTEPLFQYPRTDRVECYFSTLKDKSLPILTFSILGRIVWNATRIINNPFPVATAFSILGRIVWNATAGVRAGDA